MAKNRLTNDQRAWLKDKFDTWVLGLIAENNKRKDSAREDAFDKALDTLDTKTLAQLDQLEDFENQRRALESKINDLGLQIIFNNRGLLDNMVGYYDRQRYIDIHKADYKLVDSFLHTGLRNVIDKEVAQSEFGKRDAELYAMKGEVRDAVMLAGTGGQLGRVYEILSEHFGSTNELAPILEILKELADD